MDIFQQLKQEHQQVKQLLSQAVSSPDASEREQCFNRIQQALAVHMQGEEKFLYPPLEKNSRSRMRALEAFEEHHVARLLLQELNGLPKDTDRWAAKCQVCQEVLEHHIQEEESELFPVAQQSLDQSQQQQIYRQYQQLAQQLQPASAR